jgi:hypothetical protein
MKLGQLARTVDDLDGASTALEERGHDRFVLERIQGARRVAEQPSHLEQREAAHRNLRVAAAQSDALSDAQSDAISDAQSEAIRPLFAPHLDLL